ncbi:hypothetical protein Daus18300_000432 [Diaporthe australafricana]|uniref:Protein kinase domain-containing protein n=1 Tax=Diaporthe australafricana TaxID=127596 RepID=A0ABR3Y443_9PEZI
MWRFEEWQWTTIAPFFRHGQRKDVQHLELQDQAALPFVQDSRFTANKSAYQRLEFEGGFSNVFKVDIHPDHHDFFESTVPGRSFAIKCLLSRDQAEFKREVDTLKKFSDDSHPHLVSLLATYEQFGKFYLIFPWAEADLQGYWKMNPFSTMDREGALWLAEQCSGIAHGLTKIHCYETMRRTNSMGPEPSMKSSTRPADEWLRFRKQLFGRHGDIKPENILWYRDPNNKDERGVLKISDFGLTEFSTRHSQCYKRNSHIAHSPSYRPPECDLEGAVVGQSYDIWTLGCLYLELITWQLGGAALLRTFRQRRTIRDPMQLMSTDTFFEIVRCERTNTVGSMVKREVTDFVLGLHAHPECSEYFHDFLDLIMGQMLVVKSPNPSEVRRMNIEAIYPKLLNMLNKCKKNVEYAGASAPWPRRIDDSKKMEEAVEANVTGVSAEILGQQTLRLHGGKTITRA